MCSTLSLSNIQCGCGWGKGLLNFNFNLLFTFIHHYFILHHIVFVCCFSLYYMYKIECTQWNILFWIEISSPMLTYVLYNVHCTRCADVCSADKNCKILITIYAEGSKFWWNEIIFEEYNNSTTVVTAVNDSQLLNISYWLTVVIHCFVDVALL